MVGGRPRVASAKSVSVSAPETKEPLQVRIPLSIKRQFKAHAAIRGLEPNELFVEVWKYYERRKSV
jgi:hypothetical protein